MLRASLVVFVGLSVVYGFAHAAPIPLEADPVQAKAQPSGIVGAAANRMGLRGPNVHESAAAGLVLDGTVFEVNPVRDQPSGGGRDDASPRAGVGADDWTRQQIDMLLATREVLGIRETRMGVDESATGTAAKEPVGFGARLREWMRGEEAATSPAAMPDGVGGTPMPPVVVPAEPPPPIMMRVAGVFQKIWSGVSSVLFSLRESLR